MTAFREAERDTPIVAECDVVVAGGGPAGFAAAVAAARTGAKTILIETQGCLGGVWTSGLLSWVLDSGNKPGIIRELFDRLERQGERQPMRWGGVACDVEAMKLLLEEMCLEAGVTVRLHTRVVAAARNRENRLAVAITESKSGREAWHAPVFVDATGDGDLAACAGCGFDVGHPETGKTQPMSMLCLLTGIRYEEAQPYIHDQSGKWREDSNLILEALARVGVQPSYTAPILIKLHDSGESGALYLMMANHEYGVSGLDAQQLTEATLRSRREVHTIVNGLRRFGKPFENLRLVATGAQIGVREGRRISGHYTVTRDDLISGARHPDAICRVKFPVDVHALDPRKDGKSYGKQGVTAQPYDIPLRALIARDVDGLMMAGRCISGDFIAHSSYRVTGNAVAMGEAAGTCAGLATQRGCLPQEVPFVEVAAVLCLPDLDHPDAKLSSV
ncbi:MAG: FAD-dependent oxidoreductase [Armatimonadaceae bacterium]